MKRYVLLLALVLAVSGCASAPTGYHPMSESGGYSDLKLQDEAFRVTFSGNRLTSVHRAETLCLLRCAELTIQQGFRFFVTVHTPLLVEVACA